MCKWLDGIVDQPSTDFFLQNFKQKRSFSDLTKISILGCSSKSACYRRWTNDFITNKMALLLELNQQVVDKKKAMKIVTDKQGKAPS
jgi:hypothetical protein